MPHQVQFIMGLGGGRERGEADAAGRGGVLARFRSPVGPGGLGAGGGGGFSTDYVEMGSERMRSMRASPGC